MAKPELLPDVRPHQDGRDPDEDRESFLRDSNLQPCEESPADPEVKGLGVYEDTIHIEYDRAPVHLFDFPSSVASLYLKEEVDETFRPINFLAAHLDLRGG